MPTDDYEAYSLTKFIERKFPELSVDISITIRKIRSEYYIKLFKEKYPGKLENSEWNDDERTLINETIEEFMQTIDEYELINPEYEDKFMDFINVYIDSSENND
jgi:hypothetical protein